jgi:hypothetical protein
MAISMTCECGKKLSVKDEMLGKRVRCPVCQTTMNVPGDEEEQTAGNGQNHNKKKGAKMNGAKKSNKMIWIAAGAGVLILGFCCLGVSGVGAWFIFLRGGSTSDLEAKVAGKWVADNDAAKKAAKSGDVKGFEELAKLSFGDIEFKKDGTVVDNTPLTPITSGKWKAVSAKGDVLTVELTQGPVSKKLDIKIVDNDHLKITAVDSKMEMSFKRAP